MKKRKILSIMSIVTICTLTSCGIVNSSTSETTTTTDEIPTTTETATTTNTTTTPITTTETPTASKTTATKPTATSTSTIPVPDVTTLDIISINDLHGYANTCSSNYRTDFSLASTDYYIDSVREKEEYDNVLLIANGDMFQGTAYSNLSHGKSVINAMNQMSFDCMGIGNHEFDWGLEEVLKYWDLDESNGEANFPLINGNVDYTAKNRFGHEAYARVGEDDENDNILPYTILDKAGVKVGILSYIGPQSNDINQNKLYDFSIDCSSNTDSLFYSQVKKDAKAIKALGADIIVVNLHNGTTGNNGANTDAMNKKFASMTDADGNYFFDAIINGHTHSYQTGSISRSGGLSVPVVQAGSYGNAIGCITLEINTKEKKVASVINTSYEYIDDLNPTNKKDEAVDEVLNYEYALIKDQISDVYCVNMSFASKDNIGAWTANIMKKYSDADLAFINTGGIRSTMNACNVTVEELYELNPFDNNLCYIKAKGSEIKSFYNSNTGYYYFDDGFDVSELNDSTLYKIITIDYVYYSTYFKNAFKTATLDYEDSSVYARTLMQMDCQSKKATGLDLSSSREATLDTVGWKTK